ncbi:MAG: molybdopterin molybdotransferase MoeA [Candidatus Eremiobacteraeota bacterium]|nr:molybdopterin molybdotransferase MoeA [Candidatus Eremiobacteraeota bacterium]
MKNERRFMRGVNALLPEHGFAVDELMPPAQAVIAYFACVRVRPPGEEPVALEDASGRFLAGDIHAGQNVPALARSTMDGFAVRSEDTPGTLQLGGEVAMGEVWPGTLGRGQALSIPTGGALPTGADAVVPIEAARVGPESVEIQHAVPVGDCLTQPGDDMRAGEQLLQRGRRIAAAESSVLATLGYHTVNVFRRPKIGVLSSGDELVGLRGETGPAQVRDSNRFAIGAALRARGADVVSFKTVSDAPGALERSLSQALAECDAIVLTGGSSVGHRDMTPRAIASLGDPGIIVHGLRVKPGKPTVLAAIGSKPIIGLPGNPTSALIILEAVVAPIINALTGSAQRKMFVTAVLEEPISGREGWTWYVPVRIHDEGERYRAMPLPIHSFSTSLPARADGFIIMDERTSVIQAGTAVRVQAFSEEVS